jgi:hypothetical protein
VEVEARGVARLVRGDPGARAEAEEAELDFVALHAAEPSAAIAARTSSAWPSGFTLSKRAAILPSGPITYVVRTTPMKVRPYMDFSCQHP